MRPPRLPALALLVPMLLAGCVGAGPPTGGDGCSYTWQYGGAQVTDAYPPPAGLEDAARLLEGTTLRWRYDVTAPDLIRKADYPDEDGDYWRWQVSNGTDVSSYRGTVRAYHYPTNGSLLGVRVVHERWANGSVRGHTWGPIEAEKAKAEPPYREDHALLMPEVERVRAALAPRLGETPAATHATMLFYTQRTGCV